MNELVVGRVTFSPGPWSARKGEQNDPAATGVWGDVEGRDYSLCSVWADTDELQAGEAEANASLIAAAPDLLESCRALLTFAETLCADAGMSPNNTLLNVARAVIQQAEGAPHVA